MTPERKYCDLKHAEKLAEAEVEIDDSGRVYVISEENIARLIDRKELHNFLICSHHQWLVYPAPDSDELLEWLPKNIEIGSLKNLETYKIYEFNLCFGCVSEGIFQDTILKVVDTWDFIVSYQNPISEIIDRLVMKRDSNLANALADLAVWVKAKKEKKNDS